MDQYIALNTPNAKGNALRQISSILLTLLYWVVMCSIFHLRYWREPVMQTRKRTATEFIDSKGGKSESSKSWLEISPDLDVVFPAPPGAVPSWLEFPSVWNKNNFLDRNQVDCSKKNMKLKMSIFFIPCLVGKHLESFLLTPSPLSFQII